MSVCCQQGAESRMDCWRALDSVTNTYSECALEATVAEEL